MNNTNRWPVRLKMRNVPVNGGTHTHLEDRRIVAAGGAAGVINPFIVGITPTSRKWLATLLSINIVQKRLYLVGSLEHGFYFSIYWE